LAPAGRVPGPGAPRPLAPAAPAASSRRSPCLAHQGQRQRPRSALPPAAGRAPAVVAALPPALAPPLAVPRAGAAAPAAASRRSPCLACQGQRQGLDCSAAPLRRAPGPPPEVVPATGIPDGQGALSAGPCPAPVP